MTLTQYNGHYQVADHQLARWREQFGWNYGAVIGHPMPEVVRVVVATGAELTVLAADTEPWPGAEHPMHGAWLRR